MIRVKSLRFLPHLTGVFVLISHASTSTVSASHVPEGKTSNLPEGNRVSTQSATPICTPIFGTGKSVGVPITVEDADGNKITNLSGYTFELTNGTDTQDVTSLIQTAEQQPLLVGQTLPAYGNYQINPWGGSFREFGTRVSATGPSLDFSNSGYFFLGCTPDGNSTSVKFSAGTTLNLKSSGSIVASVALTGRSASQLSEYGLNSQTLTTAITPGGASNIDFQGLYADYLNYVEVRFRQSFAAYAVMELSNSYAGGGTTVYCYDDLVSASGGSWTWTTAGQNFLNELTSAGSNSWPILASRTTGASGPLLGVSNPCDLSTSTYEDDFFLNALAAQLVLIDGPRGNVPTAIRANVDAFQPASVLRLTRSNTNNSSQNNNSSSGSNQTSATPTQNVAPSTTLPKTGGSPFGLLTVAALLLAGGIVLTTRRQTTPSFKF